MMKLFTSFSSWKFFAALGALLICVSGSAVFAQSYCLGNCDIAWSPTQDDLLAIVNDEGLWLYQADSEEQPRFFPHQGAIGLDFSPDGLNIAVIACADTETSDGCTSILSIFSIADETWAEIATLEDRISNVQYSPNAEYIWFQSDEIGRRGLQAISLISDGEDLSIVDERYTNLIADYSFSQDGKQIVISNGSTRLLEENFNGITVWAIKEQWLVAVTEVPFYSPTIIFSDDIIFVETNASVMRWDYLQNEINTIATSPDILPDVLHHFEFLMNDEATYLVVNLHDTWDKRDFRIWNISTGQEIFAIDVPKFSDIAAVNNSVTLYTATSTSDTDKNLTIWNISDGSSKQISLGN